MILRLIVFSDEIYDRLVMGGLEHISTATVAPDFVVVTVNSLSKFHCLCGNRCGWMVISGLHTATETYRRGVIQLTSMRLCANNTLGQLVIPVALEAMETLVSMVRSGGRICDHRQATVEVLDRIDGLSYVKNKVGIYLFSKLDCRKFGITNDKRFATDLLEATHLLPVPSSGFEWGSF